MSDKHSHYHKDVSHLKSVDVYRVLELFGVTDQALGHAIKKLMCAGQRGAGKTFEQDVREAVDTLNRRLQMLAEDDNAAVKAPPGPGFDIPEELKPPAQRSMPVAHLGGVPPAAPSGTCYKVGCRNQAVRYGACAQHQQKEDEATHRDGGGSKFKQNEEGRWLQWGLDSWFFPSNDPKAVPKGLKQLPLPPAYDGHD